MREGQPLLARRIGVPRALAVLSCALALLAAQPVLAQAAAHGKAAVTLSSPAPATEAPARTAEKAHPSERPAAAMSDRAFFAATRRLHILATVEILQRLFMAELKVDSHNAPAGLIAFFDPVCIEVLDAPRTLAHFLPALDCRISPSPERWFAIEHCLSAPPIA